MPLVEDKEIYPAMVKLAGCLEVEMEKAGFSLCFCGVVPGFEGVVDFCGDGGMCEGGECGGTAWVRLSTGFTSTDGVTQIQSPSVRTMAWTLEVGAATCAFVSAEGMSLEENIDTTRRQLAQMAAMKRAILCCFRDTPTQYALGPYNPLPVLGGCVEGTWTVNLESWQGEE